jgi:hypothetical protein
VASDKPSNPTDALTAKAISDPFLVANTAPTLTVGVPVVGPNKTVTLRGTAKAPVAFIKAVQMRVDSSDPIAAAADDGLFDSTSEGYTVVTAPLSSGTHVLEVQALDQAGNMATAKVSVTVP